MAKTKKEVEPVVETPESPGEVKKAKGISVESLITPAKGDNEAQIALKRVFDAYFKQTPHRANDELEKSQLQAQLDRLA